MLDIRVTGIEPIQRNLSNVGTNFDNILRPPMVRSLARLQAAIAKYPPPPAGSTYRRTGQLGRSWTNRISAQGNKLTGELGNNTRYARWVQGHGFQNRKVHAGRWDTDEMVARANEGDIVRDFDRTIAEALP